MISRAKHHAMLVTGSLAVLVTGCMVAPPPPPPETTVELMNETGLTIDANFYISGDATDEGGLFISGNLFTEYADRPIPTLGPRDSVSFLLACDRIASMGVLRPVFMNTITFTGGESADMIILLRESGFACGDRLRFVYFVDEGVFSVRLERP